MRFGLAAALAGCMAYGVAVAAGRACCPRRSAKTTSLPAASASPVDTPEVPRASPSHEADDRGDAGESPETSGGPEGSPPDGSTEPGAEPTREPETRTPPEAEADGDHPDDATRRPADEGTPPRDGAKDWRRKVVAACRDYRSGELRGEQRRRLEEVAKGAGRVEEFCGRVLGGHGGGQGNDGGQGGGKGGNGGGDDGGDGDDGGEGGGSGGDTGGAPVPPPALPEPMPTGSYSALPHLP